MSTKQTVKLETEIDIPSDVTVTLKSNILQVKGPVGKVFRSFKKIPVNIEIKNDKIILKATGTRKKHYAILNTSKSLIKTLCNGVLKGYTIKMKIVYSHFPVTVKVEDKKVLIKNFQGEKAARTIAIMGDTKITPQKDDVILTGPVLTDITQTAARIELKTKVKNKDHRVFLDGIYRYYKSEGIEK